MPSIRPVLVKSMASKNTTKGKLMVSTSYNIGEEVLVPRPEGGNDVRYFMDQQGNRSSLGIPKGGLRLDKANRIDAENLELLKIKIANYPNVASRIVIFDDETKAAERNAETRDSIMAKAKVIELAETPETGIDAVRDLVILLRGSVAPMTTDQLVDLAKGLAEQDSARVLEILSSDRFDSARKLNRLVESGQAVVSPTGVVIGQDGSLIGENLNAAIDNVGSVEELVVEPDVEPDSDKQDDSEKNHVRHIMEQAAQAKDPLRIEQEEIERVVDTAIDKEFLNKGSNGKYKLDGSDKFNMTRESVYDFYSNNPSEAAILKKNMVERGLITDAA